MQFFEAEESFTCIICAKIYQIHYRGELTTDEAHVFHLFCCLWLMISSRYFLAARLDSVTKLETLEKDTHNEVSRKNNGFCAC